MRAELLHFLLDLVVSRSQDTHTHNQTLSPPALSPLLLYASSPSRPANLIYLLFTLNQLLLSRRILCTRYLFQLLVPRYGAQLGEGAAERKDIVYSKVICLAITDTHKYGAYHHNPVCPHARDTSLLR